MNEFTLFLKTIKNIRFYDLKVKVEAVLTRKNLWFIKHYLKTNCIFYQGLIKLRHIGTHSSGSSGSRWVHDKGLRLRVCLN